MFAHRSAFLALILALLSLPQQPAALLQFSDYKTLVSLSHSILLRVALLRESRGDLAAADRARSIADKLQLLGGGGRIWAVGWDFAWNYALSGGVPTAEIYRAGAELFDAVGDVARMNSGADRAFWFAQNYDRVMGLSKSLFRTLLRGFSKSGPLRDAILVLQKEVLDGGLLKDCLEVGASDMVAFIRVARNLFSPVDSRDGEL